MDVESVRQISNSRVKYSNTLQSREDHYNLSV